MIGNQYFNIPTEPDQDYVIDEHEILGQGTFSRVYSTVKKDTNELFACKKTECPDSQTLQAAKKEIQVLETLKAKNMAEGTLSDSNILHFESFWQQTEQINDKEVTVIYTIMPQMEQDLKSMIDRRKRNNRLKHTGSSSSIFKSNKCFEENEALYYLRLILLGLKEIHSAGIIHRDLKPENIFLVDLKLYIGDFNLSSLKPAANSFLGTPYYLAPGVLDVITKKNNNPNYNYNHGVDIWAAGLILYEMLYGVHLYERFQTTCLQMHEVFRVQDQILEDLNSNLSELKEKLFPSDGPELTDDAKRLFLDTLIKHNTITAENLLDYPIMKEVANESFRRSMSARLRDVQGSTNASFLNLDIDNQCLQFCRLKKEGSAEPIFSREFLQAIKTMILGQNQKIVFVKEVFKKSTIFFSHLDYLRKDQPREYNTKNCAELQKRLILFGELVKVIILIEAKRSLQMVIKKSMFVESAKSLLSSEQFEDLNTRLKEFEELSDAEILKKYIEGTKNNLKQLQEEFLNYGDSLEANFPGSFSKDEKKMLKPFEVVLEVSDACEKQFLKRMNELWPEILFEWILFLTKDKSVPKNVKKASLQTISLFYRYFYFEFSLDEDVEKESWNILQIKVENMTQEDHELDFQSVNEIKKNVKYNQRLKILMFVQTVFVFILIISFYLVFKDNFHLKR